MTVAQITARLSPETKARFEQCATKFGLDGSELAKLLIVRERHQKRLKQAGKHQMDEPRRDSRGRRPTVTAHLSSVKEVRDFDAYARQCGLSRNRAAACLFEAEVRERWLERAMSMR